MALYGFGNTAVPIRFKSSSDLFDQNSMVTTDVLSKEDFETFENLSSFKVLQSENKNAKSFQNFVILPPFLVVAILSTASRQLADIS